MHLTVRASARAGTTKGKCDVKTYNIGIEANTPATDLSRDDRSKAVGRLVDAFSQLPLALHPAVSWGGLFAGPGVQVTVDATDPAEAVRTALELFDEAAGRAGLGDAEAARVEVMTDEAFTRWLEEPPPALVGVSEIAKLLGVSKQRVSELRQRPDFPAPIAELAAGPVWMLPSLQQFLKGWTRKPGRPPQIVILDRNAVQLSGRVTAGFFRRARGIIESMCIQNDPRTLSLHMEDLEIDAATAERWATFLRELRQTTTSCYFHLFAGSEGDREELRTALAPLDWPVDVHVRGAAS